MMSVQVGTGDPQFWSVFSAAGRDVYTVTCIDWQARADGSFSFAQLHPRRGGQFSEAPKLAVAHLSNDLSTMEIVCDLGTSTSTVWQRLALACAAWGAEPTAKLETLVPTNNAPQAHMSVVNVLAVPILERP